MKVIGNLTKDAIIRAAVSEGITVSEVVGSEVVFGNNPGGPNYPYMGMAYDANANKIVIAYRDLGNTNRGTAVVGTVSGTSISFGTPVVFYDTGSGGQADYIEVAYDSSNNKVVIAFSAYESSASKGRAVVGTVSGTSISFGTSTVFEDGGASNYTGICFDSNSNKIVITYADVSNSSHGTAIVGTVSGTGISFGSAVVFEAAVTNFTSCIFDSSNNKVVVGYQDDGNSNYGTAIVGTVSGTSISFGTAVVYHSARADHNQLAFDSTNNKVVIAFRDNGDNEKGKAIIGTVSGTSISFGSNVTFSDAGSRIDWPSIAYDSAAQKTVISYRRYIDASAVQSGQINAGTVSGTSISFDAAKEFNSAGSNYIGSAYDSTNEKVVIAYSDAGNSNQNTAVVYRAGINSATGGTIADGKAVIVNANGTVSTISGTSRSQVLGTETVFESANSKDFAAAYDTTNDKVLIAFRDIGNYQYGTAIVGTVSGSSISFGSANVFESSATTYISVAFDSTAGKFLIAYRDEGDSSKGKAVVATVSGTSVSYGSITEFESGNTAYTSTVYDSSNGKMVISYTDIGNSSYGTAIVGTISGTSVSFGSAVVFESAATGWVSSVYDSNAQKVFIGYQDGGNSNYPTGIVGTVSGTSISFGSATAVASNGSNYSRVGFDSTNNKVLIAYQNTSDSNYGYAAVGTISGTSVSFGTSVNFSGSETVILEGTNAISFDTTSGGILIAYEDTTRDATVIRGVISGTSISFDTAVVIDTGGGSSHEYLGIVYDPDQDRHVVFYKDGAESNYGTAIVYSPAYTTSNLTTENFVGFMDGAALDGTNGEILSSCSIARNQTSLTAGQTYFVSPTDGALSLTAGSPSVTAGTAISSTELIVKG